MKVQQDGSLTGASAIVGATFAYQVVDDSDSVTHDGASTYLTLPKGAAVSFPLFLQAEGLLPSSITINVGAQRGGPAHPRLQIGFYQAGLKVFDAVMFDTTASYTVSSRTFSANPLTGAAWSASDLVGLEACIQNEAGVNGNNDITLVSGSIDYLERKNWRALNYGLVNSKG